MVRVSGSSGDSGFHRESLGEDVRFITEPGIVASAEERSSQSCEDEGSPHQLSFGRGFDEKKTKEEDRSIYPEEKLQPPPEVPSGTTADRPAKQDSLETVRLKQNKVYPRSIRQLQKRRSRRQCQDQITPIA